MLHKMAETGKTNANLISVIISLNILVMHVTKIMFSFVAKLDKLIGIITIGTGMLGTIFEIEIFMIRRNFSLH